MDKSVIEIDIKVPNQTRYLKLIGRIGEDLAKELDRYEGDREMLAYYLNLVLTEAMINAIKHAGSLECDQTVHICINIQEDELFIKVFDTGQGFDINAVPEPNFDELEESGRGIFIIKSVMDNVHYRKIDGGNVLEMYKSLRCG
ncbi:MAG TPA: ATP-binding protein [Verrucomicrobiae bacterium]|nr:ATP-binding protein [Verrucomicrobiae bacterium]